MHLGERFWASVTYVVNFITLTPLDNGGANNQAPLLPISDVSVVQATAVPTPSVMGLPPGPIFEPPGRDRSPDPEIANFTCQYPKMVGFKSCSTPDNRGCWLRNEATGFEYNISTNYESSDLTPIGIHRTYYLNVTDGWVNADGRNFTVAKLFNNTYPGPWIQGCWGDNITVIVTNKMKHNGTSVHWHGIRQWLTMHMDGVNGVTQCPIAPEDSFNYTFRAMQYGSSWYHSHFSVQYADGVHGPLTLHGPSTSGYDEAKIPILMTDWGHNSAFEAIWWGDDDLKYPSILLNGVGNVTRWNTTFPNNTIIPDPYSLHFSPEKVAGKAKRYLLRLINTSFESTFVFSIDHHVLRIVGADFVPIHNYTNSSVLVGIGQRYHVIVEAEPQPYDDKDTEFHEKNFWIRTWRANCFRFATPSPHYEKAGVLRYDLNDNKSLPTTRSWNNTRLPISLDCADEEYTSLKPYIPWTVGTPANSNEGSIGEDFIVHYTKNKSDVYPLAGFSMRNNEFDPLRINYGNPTFLHLKYTGNWNPDWVVVPENYTEKDWVYMVIRGIGRTTAGSKNTSGAHPMHLHGHDFAILQSKANASYPEGLNLKYDNPPRRDVVLLPSDGYVVIAFKADNPGNWLMHCHIAFHASFGLGLQILERQKAAAEIWPDVHKSEALATAQTGCNKWNEWYGNCTNWWPGDGSHCLDGENWFSPDSGI